MYTGWLIKSRHVLLQQVPPVHPVVIAHHITYALGGAIPPYADTATVIGWACDDEIQAVVVEVNGMRKQPRGHPLHITISLVDGVAPFQSVSLLTGGFTPCEPFDIVIEPKVFE